VDQVKYVAVRNHNPEATSVLHVFNGDELNYERRKTIYPGWIWCTDRNGVQAWVPEAFVTIEGNRCYMMRDYISREMVIEVGDIVDVTEIESGWAWVSNKEGENGWTPMECLERLIL
jgi:hypothetical protein